MRPEDFERFMKALSPDPEEAVRRYANLHKKLIGFFILKGDSDPESAADTTIDRAAEKISNGAVVPDVEKYCLGIARNIIYERLRARQRETLAFLNFVESLNNSSAEQVERIYDILKPCFEQLDEEGQKLLVEYCHKLRGSARAEHRRQLAKAMNLTLLALRIRVSRLRDRLTDCVRKRSNKA